MVNKLIKIAVVIALLTSCTFQGDRTDWEMFQAANKVYQDYLFEYGIDSKLLSAPVVENCPNSKKSYKWLVLGMENVPVGVEVIVSKQKTQKPEMILMGDKEWLSLIGSKREREIRGHHRDK